jgi:predicted ATPase
MFPMWCRSCSGRNGMRSKPHCALGSESPPSEERVVAFAFLSTLRQVAVGNRLLLAIDDVQWLDAPSLAMLRFALLRRGAEPVAVILTARDECVVAPLERFWSGRSYGGVNDRKEEQ